MRRTHKIATTALAASLVSGVFGVAGAGAAEDTQSITGTVENSLSVDLSTPTVNETLAVGTNTIAGGTLTVSANVLATVAVAFDKTAMTEWDGTAYVTGGNVLGLPMGLTALSGGASAGTATSTTNGTLLSTDLVGESVFDLSYEQTVGLDDAPGTYHIQVTYTATPVL